MPLAFSILQARQAIIRIENNRVAKRFLRLAQANPNEAFWQVERRDLKKVIDNNSGAALVKQTGRTWDESATAGRKAAEDRKNTFYTVPASELANWRNASASLYDEWVADVSAKGNDGKALLVKAQDLIKKYEKK